MEGSVRGLQEDLMDSRDKHETCKEELGQTKEELTSLQKAKARLDRELKEEKDKREKSGQELVGVKRELSQLRIEADELRANLQREKGRLEKTAGELDELRQETEEEIDTLLQEKRDLLMRIEGLNTELDASKRDTARFKLASENLTQTVERNSKAAAQDIETLQGNVRNLKGELASKTNTYEARIAELRRIQEEMSNRVEQLTQSNKATNELLTESQQKAGGLQKELDRTSQAKLAIEADFRKLKLELESAHQEKERRENSMNRELSEVKDIVDRLRKEKQDLEQDLSRSRQQMEAMSKAAEDAQREMILEMQTLQRNKETAIGEGEREIISLKYQLESIRSEFANLRTKHEELQKQHEETSRTLLAAERRKQDLMLQLEEAQSALRLEKEKAAEREAASQKRFNALQAAHDELTRVREGLDSRVRNLDEALDNLREDSRREIDEANLEKTQVSICDRKSTHCLQHDRKLVRLRWRSSWKQPRPRPRPVSSS
jgi:chromosome segregation ATPase